MDKKKFEKRGREGRHLVIANPKKRSRSEWCQSIQNFLENKMDKKKFEKRGRDGHHLVIANPKKKGRAQSSNK